jgi:hypothetical protein
MAEMGVAPHIVEKLLNHQSGTLGGIAGIYNRFEYIEERKRALDAWSARLLKLVESRKPTGNVVALRG